MSRRKSRALGVVCAAAIVGGATAVGPPASAQSGRLGTLKERAQHVLLISVDGMHQSDLDWYVRNHRGSVLARLTRDGMQFTGAQTPVPSDSFPGMVAQATGGNPSSTGIYYDDSFNHDLLPAGTTSCAGVAPGVEVTYFEQLDKNQHALDAGQGLPGLPGNILSMTGDPRSVIDTTQLPVDPVSCRPVFPHTYLKVNTIFEVARAAGLRTAWSDKHASYEVLNGPSGSGVQDLFTPEINSDAPTLGSPVDWTKDNQLTRQYDNYKVQSVVNEINGFDHSGTTPLSTPSLFGMNFQAVSTAQKLPASNGLPGGYLADGVTPGPLLTQALDFINSEIGAQVEALKLRHLDGSTAIILSAKHGQSPQLPSALKRIPDGPITDALNAAWSSAHPGASNLVAFSVDDDGVMMWLSDRSAEATAFAKTFLLGHAGAGNDINGNPAPYAQSGLSRVFAGDEAAAYFKAAPGDSRVPDVFGVAQYGVVYTGGHGKIAEHGGANAQDRDVPLVVSGAPVANHEVNTQAVETTQIAPTILALLGLDPWALQSVQIEHTRVLPDVVRHDLLPPPDPDGAGLLGGGAGLSHLSGDGGYHGAHGFAGALVRRARRA